MKLINLKCETCGANLKRSAVMKTLECEYCGSTYLAETQGQSHGLEGETFLIPIEIDSNGALKNLINVIKSSPFIHEDTEKIVSGLSPKGVMVPCYIYECQMTANWSGENSVDKTRQVFNPVTGMYIIEPYKEWYPQNGQHFGQHNVFVSASGALKESESWGLFPLPIERQISFSEGDESLKFSLEVPNMFPEEIWQTRGERYAKWMEEEACRTLVERLRSVNSKVESKKACLIYTPVWIFNYKVNNIPYRNIVCGVRGLVLGEIPTNFEKLFEELRKIQKDIDQKNMLMILAGAGGVLMLLSVALTIFCFVGFIGAYFLYQEMNKLKIKFDTCIAANKYNLCYYLLKQRNDLRNSLNIQNLPGIDVVEKLINDEEGAKIDNNVAKELVTRYLKLPKPQEENKTQEQSMNVKLATREIKVTPQIEAAVNALENAGKTCGCGQNLLSDWKVCPRCGTRIN